jgi:hypothetical protein
LNAARTTRAFSSDFIISLKLLVVNFMTVGYRWNLANFRNLSSDVGNDNDPRGLADKEENASRADVGGGFAIDRLEYKRESTEV